MASLQSAHWHRVYADLVGTETLATVDEAEMAARWTQIISSPADARMRVLVALTGPTVHGLAFVHPCHDPDADQISDGEIGEFIIAADHQRSGHGSRLLQACADTMRADGFRRGIWWLDSTDDSSRGFAESAGWAPDGAHREFAGANDQRIKQIRLHTALM